MKKILTILVCFALLLVLACPITAEVDQYLLIVNFTDSVGNVIAAPLTVKFSETINADNIPLDVNGYKAYGVLVSDIYANKVSITEDGYLSVSDVKESLIVNVNYTVAMGYTPVSDITVNVNYVDNFSNIAASAESSIVYADANGIMYVLPAVCGAYYPNGLVEVVASQTITESTPVLMNELEPEIPETEVTTVTTAEDTSSQISTDASDEVVTTTTDTTPLPEGTTSSTESIIVTTYSAVTPAAMICDVVNASYNYTVYYLDMNSKDEFNNLATIHSETVDASSAVVNADEELTTVAGTYKLYSEFGTSALLSKISNFDASATNEIYFYYQLNSSGSLIVTRNSGADNYKFYTLELVGTNFLARFALKGNDIILFDELPEGTYLITDIDAGSNTSDVIVITRGAETVYEVADVSYLNETESGWFTAQYSTTVTVDLGITE